MPTLRRPLGVIAGNIEKRKELTPYKRGLILGAKLSGRNEDEISECFKVPESTVQTTIARAAERNEGQSKPQSGRPKCLSDREE